MSNFFFDSAKMTAWKTLPNEEFRRLFPTVTDEQIINTARLEMLSRIRSYERINASEHDTEIFSQSY